MTVRRANFFESVLADHILLPHKPRPGCDCCSITLLGALVRASFVLTVIIAATLYRQASQLLGLRAFEHARSAASKLSRSS